MKVSATSSAQPNKANFRIKYMLCVKARGCDLNTIFENRIHFVYSFRQCIAFLSLR